MDNQLQHWGIKGMKWGKRRYQNEDGTLTEAGKKRYYREADAAGYKEETAGGGRYKTKKGGKRENFYVDTPEIEEWVRRDTQNAKSLAENSGQMARNLKQINDKSLKNRPKAKMDLSNMSDQDMRNQINRALLERQYNDMFAPQKQARGREFVSKALEVGGDVLTVSATALGIALSIQALRNGKG